MRPRREHHHRVAEVGKEIATRPFQLVTRRAWKGAGGSIRTVAVY